MSILKEIKRRKMAQVAAVYLVVAWLTMQVVDVIDTPLRLPEWFPTVVIVFLAIGFPIALIISWAFNVTSGGIEREAGKDHPSPSSGRTIEFVLLGLGAIAIAWLLYRTEFSEQPAPEPQVAEAIASDILPNSIAVLPFANLSPDPDNAFFAAGIHDTILNELAKISDMHVISRSAMLRYGDGMTPIPQVAEELRVGAVMEGSVQYANGRVLVTAQLIDPKTNSHLWSENYDREFADIFAIQADIATQIAAAMRTEISVDERLTLAKQMTSSPEAYAFYMRAMEIVGDFGPTDSFKRDAYRLLDEAIAVDPNFAHAYAAKANLEAFHRDGQAQAVELAEKALFLDPDLGIAYMALALVHTKSMREKEAYDAFETALRLSPSDTRILDDFARFLIPVDPQRAVDLANRQLTLDPGSLNLLIRVQRRTGDIDAAIKTNRNRIALEPTHLLPRLSQAHLEFLSGNVRAAEQAARTASDMNNDEGVVLENLLYMTQVFGLLGFDEDAITLHNQFLDEFGPEPTSFSGPNLYAAIYAATGEFDKAFRYLALGVEEVEAGFRSGGRSIAENRFQYPELEQPEFVELRRRLRYEIPGL